MRVHVNGEERDVPEGASLLKLLESLGVERTRIAVELNTEIVRRARHAEVQLKEGDHVEIVTFVGGG
jgi:thiamine biosynthesis protein ThiS